MIYTRKCNLIDYNCRISNFFFFFWPFCVMLLADTRMKLSTDARLRTVRTNRVTVVMTITGGFPKRFDIRTDERCLYVLAGNYKTNVTVRLIFFRHITAVYYIKKMFNFFFQNFWVFLFGKSWFPTTVFTTAIFLKYVKIYSIR